MLRRSSKLVKMQTTLSGVQESFLFYELKTSLLQVNVGEKAILKTSFSLSKSVFSHARLTVIPWAK